MRWWNGFGRSVLFAALAAAACPLFLGTTGWLLGWNLALSSFVVLAAAVYLFGIAPGPTRGLGAMAAVGASALALLALGASGLALIVAMALVLGVLRSGLLAHDARGSFARRFAVELPLIGGGLALAFHLGRGAFFPEALAVWGFFLVQSAFFLVGGPDARGAKDAPREVDPFERACRRAAELLDETA